MSATGAWVVPTRAFEASLGELKAWRDSVAGALASFRRWALVARLIDEQTSARLAYLERRLAVERLTIAFVAEYARGKSELINALFFADMGTRLLPSSLGRATLCPTEILWDSSRPPSIRVLPIETRDSPKALRELMSETGAWQEIALDPTRPDTIESTCRVLCETITIPTTDAVNLGFAPDDSGRVQIPRWRYAIVNFPHPLLASGLVVLDTPGHSALAAEPELTFHRVPDAAAIVFVVAVDSGMAAGDRALWAEHIAPIAGLEQTCFIVLNKIDGLRDGVKSEAQVFSEIDVHVRATAEALGVEPTRVFPLSARQGLVAKMHSDRDGAIKSRLYRLEQALAKGLVHQRRVDHASAVLAEIRSILSEARTVIDSRIEFARDQLEELSALQGKNQKLVESLARKAADERSRLERARTEMISLRSIHNRHADELGKLLDPNAVREAGINARMAVLNSRFSGQIGGSLDTFFQEARQRLERSVEIINDVKGLMVEAAARYARDYGIRVEAATDFATERFLLELERLEEHCDRDFKSTSSLVMRGRKTLGTLFFDTVAPKVIHIFEIADREVRTWMNGFIRPLDAQLNAFQEQANAHIEGMGRIQNAETDLVTKLGELQSLIDDGETQRGEWRTHQERFASLLTVERDHSLA